MTGQQINSLVGDLVAMAQAMQQLPEVQQELSVAQASNEHLSQTIGHREETILRLKAEIETLQARIRDAEVSRDDAEFRFLEAEERTAVAVDFIKTQFGSAGALIQRLEPPRPEPVIEPAAVSPEVAVQSEEQVSTGGVSEVVQVPDYIKEPVWDNNVRDAQPVGQSEPLPTDSRSMGGINTSALTPISSSVDPAIDVLTAESSWTERYRGKLYMKIPGFISRSEWLAGGGTEEAYYWREGQPLPDGIANAA